MPYPELIDRIDQRLKALNLSDRKASLDAKLNSDAIRNIRRGRAPSVETLTELAKVLKVPPQHFLEAVGSRELGEAPSMGRPEIPEPLAAAEPRLPPLETMPRDVPVYGVAAGSGDLEDSFNIEADVVDYARRPPALLGTRDVYGLYVIGDSMEPAYRRGALIYVRRKLPPRVGDDVVIQLKPRREGEPPACFIKRLVRRTATKIVTEQFNPKKPVEFSWDRVHEMHRVLRPEEFLGV